MEQTAKKQWQKPELIVLVRNKPEEAVLAACKSGEQGGASFDYADACQAGSYCFDCEVRVGS